MTRPRPDRPPRRPVPALLAVGSWLLCLALPGIAAQPADLDALMSLLGQVKRVEVSYQETVESALIDTAISTRGRLVYQAPDRIRRISDRQEGFALDGDRMQLIADGRVINELVISGIAPLEAMVGALRATFAGDLPALRADYRLNYQPESAHWVLELAPRGRGLSNLFRGVEIVGDGASITTIAMEEADGDQRTLRMRLLARDPPGLD